MTQEELDKLIASRQKEEKTSEPFINAAPYNEEAVPPIDLEKVEKVVQPILSEIDKDVNHPSRYGGDTIYECIKVLKAWNTPEEYKGFLKDNAIKYLCRAGKKDEVLKEYKKARFYIDKLIEFVEEHNE